MQWPSDIIHYVLVLTGAESPTQSATIKHWKHTSLVARGWREISQRYLFTKFELNTPVHMENYMIVQRTKDAILFFQTHARLSSHVKALWTGEIYSLILYDNAHLRRDLHAVFPNASTLQIRQPCHHSFSHELFVGVAHLKVLHYHDFQFSEEDPWRSAAEQLPPSISLTTLKIVGHPARCLRLIRALSGTSTRHTLRRCEVTWIRNTIGKRSYTQHIETMSKFSALECLMVNMSSSDPIDGGAYSRDSNWYNELDTLCFPSLKELRICPPYGDLQLLCDTFGPAGFAARSLPRLTDVHVQYKYPYDVATCREIDPVGYMRLECGHGTTASGHIIGLEMEKQLHSLTLGFISDLPLKILRMKQFQALFWDRAVTIVRYQWTDHLIDVQEFDDVKCATA